MNILKRKLTLLGPPIKLNEYITDGLVFRFDGITNLREGHISGNINTIYDISGNNYDFIQVDGAAIAYDNHISFVPNST